MVDIGWGLSSFCMVHPLAASPYPLVLSPLRPPTLAASRPDSPFSLLKPSAVDPVEQFIVIFLCETASTFSLSTTPSFAPFSDAPALCSTSARSPIPPLVSPAPTVTTTPIHSLPYLFTLQRPVNERNDFHEHHDCLANTP